MNIRSFNFRLICAILVLSIFNLALFSCSYHKTLDSDVMKKESFNPRNAIPLTIAVSDSTGMQNLKIKTDGSSDVDLQNGLIASTYSAMSSIFQKTVYVSQLKGQKNYDLLVEPYITHDMNSFNKKSQLTLILAFYNNQGSELPFIIKSSQDLNYEFPAAAATPLLIITLLSLFILSVITFPIITQMEGSNMVDAYSSSMKNAFEAANKDIIGNRDNLISYSKGLAYAGKEAAVDKKLAPSPYDALLNSVVLINTSYGLGSGFFITSNGYLVTNEHVVGNDKKVIVTMRNNKITIANVLKTDEKRDLALLYVKGTGYPFLKICPIDQVSIGAEVISIGAPQGLDWSVSKGIVSSVRDVNGISVIQSDVGMNPGNSGGPLILLSNRNFIGINSFGFSGMYSQRLNFSISADELLKAFPQLSPQKNDKDKPASS
jgi:S1-C subfamily serine protease